MLLTSPVPTPVDLCAGLETLAWRLCQPRVVNLGPWNPIPVDYSTPTVSYSDPKDWGAYVTEGRK